TLSHADVITDWNTAALNTIRASSTSPPIASRSLAILHISIYDAANGIARTNEPVTAIRNAETDGNPATDPDTAWNSFIVTPPFPDYVSGHSTFSGAAATVLPLFYGTEDLPF